MKKVKVFFFVALFLLATYSLYRTYNDVSGKGVKVDDLANEVSQLQEENDNLRLDIAKNKTRETIEKNAIDKLGLIKPNQKIIVVPEQSLKPTESEVLGDSDKGEIKSNREMWKEKFLSNNPFRFN